MCPYFGGELIWGSSDYGNEQIMGPLSRRRRTLNLTHYAKSHASENTHQWVATSWSFWTCNQNFVLIFCKILLQLKTKLPYLELHEMIHLRTMVIYQDLLFDFVEDRGYEPYEPP